MPAFIYSRDTINREFAYVPDKSLRLSSSTFLRKLGVGCAWSALRVGILVSVTPNGSANLYDCPFFFGMTSSRFPDNPGSATNTGNFYGFSIVGAYAAGSVRNLTYTNPASGYAYYTPTVGLLFRRCSGIVYNSATINAPLLVPSDSGTARRRVPLVLWICRNKGGGGLPNQGTAINTVLYGMTTAANVAQDYRPDDLISALDQYAATPTIRGQAMTVCGTFSSVNIGESHGELDTLEIYWGNATSPLEIHAIVGQVYAGLSDGYSPVDLTNARTPGGAEETFDTYAVGTATGAIFNAGTCFEDIGAFWGSGSPLASSGMAGSSAGWPDETFEQYGTGTVTADYINAGTAWNGAAVIF